MIETLAIGAVAAFFVGVVVAALTSTALSRAAQVETKATRPDKHRQKGAEAKRSPALDPSAHAAMALASVQTAATRKHTR